ncbi:MAG: SET domain-containing protein [Magnetococcus sp. DMHC-1]|nr:SET domain-containing protein [Magnetococcales bacterium]
MLLVKTVIGPSQIHGIGLFANQVIEEGTLVGRLTQWDVVVEREGLPQQLDDFFMDYSIFTDRATQTAFQTYCDNMRFMNHSKQPNCLDRPNGDCVAVRKIYPGEEMTCDYGLISASDAYK